MIEFIITILCYWIVYRIFTRKRRRPVKTTQVKKAEDPEAKIARDAMIKYLKWEKEHGIPLKDYDEALLKKIDNM